MSADKVPSFKLNDGNSIPALAFGLGTSRKNDSDASLIELTKNAIETGFLHLDGAQMYDNEEELGAAIRASNVPRSSLFVTTKHSYHYKLPAPESLAESLSKLGLDYVDLFLIHHPFTSPPGTTPDPDVEAASLRRTWAHLEDLAAAGKARSIGVSNFRKDHLEIILREARVVPAVNQIEFHPYLQHGDLLDFHRKHGIVTAAYGPLVPLTRSVDGPVVPLWKSLAEKYGVTESEVGLRWALDQGVVAVTTSSKHERLRGYIERLSTFSLAEAEVREISEAGKQKHYRAFFLNRYAPDDTR
ncbi:related to aldo-keto reductase YPR1 [Cephalotrichum gorgonifer]|uniref:Related to aldo-keto reductase YPR1 n=1 Tax=Cephalotrichum gorgonifer TaxID=2041049 RepID=A0AAE8N3Q9_9PEZI|nr:related to aldo-keto reductase YPR1 [Cephalotrichum gorgonifer]